MPSRQDFDLSVYFVADPSLCGGRDLLDIVKEAVKGGVSMVQLRNKDGAPDEIYAQALSIQSVLAGSRVAFLVNDYVEIAKFARADGVHLGQDDMDPKAARKALGPEAIIGLTAFTPAQIKKVSPKIVDYIGTGPFFETKTKKGKPVLGAEGFAPLATMSKVPVVGIGGVTAGNAGEVIAAGADGVAMMRAISEAENPARAAEEFVCAVTVAKLTRAVPRLREAS